MKNIIFILFLLIGITMSCSKYTTHPITGFKTFPKKGLSSSLMKFETIGIMDTITSVLRGKVVDLKTDEGLAFSNVVLGNEINKFEIVSDTSGNFELKHFKSGTYKLTISYVGYNNYTTDSLFFGSGEIKELKVGLGYLGSDNLKN